MSHNNSLRKNVTKRYGLITGCQDVSFELFPGEVLGIVGESGSGKSTLLNCISGHLEPTSGAVKFATRKYGLTDMFRLSEADRRRLQREELGFVHQNPRDGLRMRVSAGANVAEPLMNLGNRHYGSMREDTVTWLNRVELDIHRIDDNPRNFSGGMQQRIQIARNLVHGPRLVFMDEPTGGLDVSVQARLLEFPAGTLEEGEDPLESMQRELGEEAGYSAARWDVLGPMLPCPGYSDEVIHCFLARELSPLENPPAGDDDEDLEVVLMSPAELDARLASGEEWLDGKSVTAWFRAKQLLGL